MRSVMTTARARRITLFLSRALGAALTVAACAASAWAQCAMCKSGAENLDPASVKNLNLATLLLLCPPVAIFCCFIYAAYRRRDPPGEDE